MKTTIIMPSIRVPQNVRAWAALLDPATDEIIIAGNQKSPHNDIVEELDEVGRQTGVLTIYLHPEDERVTEKVIHPFTPANHTTRRNFALLEALERRPDVLVSLDDDNFPYLHTWLDGVKMLLESDVWHHRPVIQSASGWWNAGRLCNPKVIHRGWPLTRWYESDNGAVADGLNPRIGVVASLWLGDPDISALERITSDPLVKDVLSSVVLAPGTWCPFDSQSTAVHGDLADMMYMWPEVGRYDDIWSSYVMRAVMDVTKWHITYGQPTVTQERNPHNLLRDLEDELFGYKYTDELTNHLRDIVQRSQAWPSTMSVYEVFKRFLLLLMAESNVIPMLTRDSFTAWLTDVDDVRARTLPTTGELVTDGPTL